MSRNKQRNRNRVHQKNTASSSNLLSQAPLKENDFSSTEVANSTQAQSLDHDENLLKRARTQWQFGDWESLLHLQKEKIEVHPARDELSLLVAAAYLQLGKINEGSQFIRQALNWGCDWKSVNRILISGVYNNLGRFAATAKQLSRAYQLFECAITVSAYDSDKRLISTARANQQYTQLGLLPATLDKSQLCPLINTTSKRLIIANGMIRSGSTVVFNIVIDLLKKANCQFVKYYISDFSNANKIRDHLLQNEEALFLIKTHSVNKELLNISREFSADFVYTKRNLFEVSASYIRMTKNKDSPFYKENDVSLVDLIKVLDDMIKEYLIARALDNCLMIDCEDFRDSTLEETVIKIKRFLKLEVSPSEIKHIAIKNRRQVNANLVSFIDKQQLTSLGHDKNTFFHKEHVICDGTNPADYLSSEWKESIYNNFKEYITKDGVLF
jgi:tetratricopeptide (TPR) repeat protein